jgi:ABC-2 type transport system permease protein
MDAILSLAAKDLKLLQRDRVGFFFTFAFPLVYAVFFGMISKGFSEDPRLKIAVVDLDGSSGSAAFVQTLSDAEELIVTSCDEDTAEDLVRRGKRVAFVTLTPGFGAARERLFWGDPPRVEIGLDPSRQAESGMLQGLLTRYLMEGFSTSFTDPERVTSQVDTALSELQGRTAIDPAMRTTLQAFLPALKHFVTTMPKSDGTSETGDGFAGFQPVVIESRTITRDSMSKLNPYAISFPQGIIWGIMGCAAAFAISLVVERTRGTLVRLCTAPVDRYHILAGKATACFATTCGVAWTLIAIGTLAFDLRPASWLMLAVGLCCISIAFVGIMMLLSTLGRTEQAAAGVGWAGLLVMAMIGGGMIPLAFMPPFLATLSNVSPVKWSIYAMEGALWRGLSWSEMMMPFGILIGVGVVCFMAGVTLFKWDAA